MLPLPSAVKLPAIAKKPPVPVLVPLTRKEYVPLRLALVKPPLGSGASALEPQPASARMARDKTTEDRTKPYFLDIIPLVTRILRRFKIKRSNSSENSLAPRRTSSGGRAGWGAKLGHRLEDNEGSSSMV